MYVSKAQEHWEGKTDTRLSEVHPFLLIILITWQNALLSSWELLFANTKLSDIVKFSIRRLLYAIQFYKSKIACKG